MLLKMPKGCFEQCRPSSRVKPLKDASGVNLSLLATYLLIPFGALGEKRNVCKPNVNKYRVQEKVFKLVLSGKAASWLRARIGSRLRKIQTKSNILTPLLSYWLEFLQMETMDFEGRAK